MREMLTGLGILLFLGLMALWALRLADLGRDGRAWSALAATADPAPARFDPAVIADLPEPARRFLGFAIRPGTPLRAVAEIGMAGRIGMGTKARPGYRAMAARQILAAPHGLVWRLESGALSGSDGLTEAASWTRFRLFGLVPVVRAGGADHRRSAFGRVVAEAAIWTPAALMPGPGVRWEAAGPDTARAVVTHGDLEQQVEITLAADGQPRRVTIPRWSNANPEKVWRVQPFGGDLSDFRDVAGFRVPFQVEGGNLIGTEDYFPFYVVDVTELRFLP
jgi:hypothetical protein